MEKDKRLEVAEKLIEMSKALKGESNSVDSESLSNIFVLLGGLTLHEGDLEELDFYLTYFVSKKTQEKLDSITKNGFGGLSGLGSIFPPSEDE